MAGCRASSALVALGAMLGGEVFQRHFEHVVAADADAVDLFGRRRAGLGGFGLGLGMLRVTHDVSFFSAA